MGFTPTRSLPSQGLARLPSPGMWRPCRWRVLQSQSLYSTADASPVWPAEGTVMPCSLFLPQPAGQAAHLKEAPSTQSCMEQMCYPASTPHFQRSCLGAQGWCTGMTQRDGMGREVGGGFRMGNTCKSMADSYQCMAKTTTIL